MSEFSLSDHENKSGSLDGDPRSIIGPPSYGSPCPNCGVGKLDYNGLLELECPVCGFRNSCGAGYT